MRNDRTIARTVLTAANTGYTEPVMAGWIVARMAGSDNSSNSSGAAVSSGSRPTPARTASLPRGAHAVSIANGIAMAGPAARKRTYGSALGCVAATRPIAVQPRSVWGH